MKVKQAGFTLMEMIGVMAVIAILAAVATPKIFDAIEDGKANAFVQEANIIKVAAAEFYKDTGRWPRHIPSDANSKSHNLMVNDLNGSGKPIPGWDGPYLDRELVHQVTAGAYQGVFTSSSNNWVCDLDGDGARDGSFLVYRADNISDTIARKISNIIDKDGDIKSGNKRWQNAGKVRRYGSNSNSKSILVYCLTKI